MKKILLITTAIIFVANVALNAEEHTQEEETQLRTTIGISFDIVSRNNKFNSENYGASAFFRKNFDDFIRDNSYWSINAGYMRYKENERIRNDYSVTFAFMGSIVPTDNKSFMYFGFEAGMLYKMQNDYYVNEHFHKGFNGLEGIFGIHSGLIFPSDFIPNLDWDFTMKIQYTTSGMVRPGISIGLSHSF